MKRDNFYRLVLILCSVVQMGISCILLNSLSNIEDWSAVYAEDSRGYLLVARYFAGEVISQGDMSLMRYRLFSPGLPLLASAAGSQEHIEFSFLAINILLWLFAVLIFYELIRKLLTDSLSAFACGLIFTTSLPLIEWGLPVMTDMAAWFFAALIILIYLSWNVQVKAVSENKVLYGADRYKYFVFFGLLVGAAVLTKPTLVMLLLFVILSLLFDRRRLGALAVLAFASALIFGAYFMLNLSIEDFKTFGSPRHRGVLYLLSAAFFCFHWGWFFFFKGWRAENKHKKYFTIYIISFIVPYLIFVHNPRLFFLSYPAVIPLIVKGIRVMYPDIKKTAFVICLYILTSNVLAGLHLYVMRTIGIRDFESLSKFILHFI